MGTAFDAKRSILAKPQPEARVEESADGAHRVIVRDVGFLVGDVVDAEIDVEELPDGNFGLDVVRMPGGVGDVVR